MYALALDDTGVGNRPPSVRPDPPGDPDGETESHRTEFGVGFGDQFTYAMYAPEPDDTGDGDRLPSVNPDLSSHPIPVGRVTPTKLHRMTLIHHPCFLECIGAPKSARLLGRSWPNGSKR